MTIDEIERKVDNTLTVMGFEITPDQFAETFGTFIDSLEVVELAYNVETVFGITISNDELEQLKNLNDMVALVNNKINN